MPLINYQGKNMVIKVDLKDEADVSVWAEIFKYKEYRSAEQAIIEANYPIIDVGAHKGFFTLYARDLNLTVPIYALEPEPKNLAVLKQNIKSNRLKNIVALPLALAEKSGKRKLLVSKDSHNHRLIIDRDVQNDIIEVKTTSLTDLIKKYDLQKISLLKMDIEGGEYEVVRGLGPADYKKIESMILEYHDDTENNHKELEETLRQNGFGVRVFPSRFDKSMGFLFANNKR